MRRFKFSDGSLGDKRIRPAEANDGRLRENFLDGASESARQGAILERNNLRARRNLPPQQFDIYGLDEAGIDDAGRDSLLAQNPCHFQRLENLIAKRPYLQRRTFARQHLRLNFLKALTTTKCITFNFLYCTRNINFC